MTNRNNEYENCMAILDECNARFVDGIDDTLTHQLFEHLGQVTQKDHCSLAQLTTIKHQLNQLLAQLTDKKQHLQQEMVQTLKRQEQINRYLNNANL